MVKDLCFNGTVAASTNNYSSPIPLVGLYIAAASMVCVLLIVCDVWAGFRHKKYWFPCRFFSINSVTLTLISIAAKIPVDLTTNMPSELDQLSKLCGTVFVCMSMSFMLPSLGTNAVFESYANVIALSIFVITVVVNIGIQMATGVIFSFKAEHAIVLVSMLVLLLCFWMSVSSITAAKNDKGDKSADLTRNGEENMLGRLKLCYIYGYHSCIQLYTCVQPELLIVYTICMTCSAVLVQAALRSLALKELKFCVGVSDYAWSMRLVVASQFFAVALVTFAVGGRWLIFFVQDLDKTDFMPYMPYEEMQYFFSCRILPKSVGKIFTVLVDVPRHLVLCVMLLLVILVHSVLFPFVICGYLCGVYVYGDKLDEKSEAFKNQLIPRGVDVENWVLKKGVADMVRWMEINDVGSLKHLTSLLSTVPPSIESSYCVGLNGEEIKISLLPLMLLVEIAKVVMTPASQDHVSFAHILDEVFEIIYFIDIKVNMGSSKDREVNRLARVIHKYGIADTVAGFSVKQYPDLEKRKVDFQFIHAPDRCLESVTTERHIKEAASLLNDFINYHPEESIEVAHGRIKQAFVDMLHTFLAQLPTVVFTHILESPVEEYDERVRLGLGYMGKLQSIQSFVKFSLPPVSNITSLFHTQTDVTYAQVQGVSTTSPNSAQAITNLGEIQQDEHATGQQV